MRFKSGITYNVLAILSTVYAASLTNDYDTIKILQVSIFMLFTIRIAFLINNLYDIREDRINPKGVIKNPFIVYNENMLYGFKIASFALALLATILIHLTYMITLITAVYGFLLLLDIIYSAPPRLKEKPPFDIISHSLYFGSLLVYPPLLIFGIAIDLKLIKLLLGISLLSMSMELGNHISDNDYDRSANIKTFSTKYGIKKAKLVFKITYTLGILLLANTVIENLISLVMILIILILTIYKLDEDLLNKTCGIIVNGILILNIIFVVKN